MTAFSIIASISLLVISPMAGRLLDRLGTKAYHWFDTKMEERRNRKK